MIFLLFRVKRADEDGNDPVIKSGISYSYDVGICRVRADFYDLRASQSITQVFFF